MAAEAIEAVNAKIKEGMKNRDSAAISACYTEDCQLLVPGKPIVVGRAAYKKTIEKDFFKLGGITSLDFERLSFIDAGEYAVEVANWSAKNEAGEELHGGKYTGVFRKDTDGEWRVHIDCSNSNA